MVEDRRICTNNMQFISRRNNDNSDLQHGVVKPHEMLGTPCEYRYQINREVKKLGTSELHLTYRGNSHRVETRRFSAPCRVVIQSRH